MATIKIHVHPTPTHSDYDYHLPFHGEVYDKDTYCEKLKKLVPVTSEIVLTSNGEPDQRLSIALSIPGDFKNIRIENHPSVYAKEDFIFFDQSFSNLPKKNRSFQDIVDYYLKNYKTIPFTQSEDLMSFRGLAKRDKVIWYHYGRGMPNIQHTEYQNLNQLLEPVFSDLAQCLQTKLNQLGLDIDVENNLVMRLNHNEPKSENPFVPEFLVLPHLDTSILSVWVWASHPGATIYQDQAGNHPTEVQHLHDQDQEYCIIPGLDYCDFSSSMKSATWHGVQNQNLNQHRVGIVAFLRHPRYNR
jgi:hypothetical protein